MGKDKDAFRTIGEVSESLALPQHVIRFWEVRFPQLSPLKRGGNRRYYRPEDVALIAAIKRLLYDDGYTIKGVQRLLRSQGKREVAAAVLDDGRPAYPDTYGAPSEAPQADEPKASAPPHQSVSPDVSSKVLVSQAEQIASLAAEIVSCAQRLGSARKAAG